MDWPEADSIVVLARDNFYLINSSNPEDYVTVDPPDLVDSVLLDDAKETLFVAGSDTVHAYDRSRRRLWSVRSFGGYFP